MISRYFKFDTHRMLHNLRKSTTSHCFRGCLRMDEVVRNEKKRNHPWNSKDPSRCSPQGAPCTYYKPPSFGIPGREPPMPQLKVSNQVSNKEIFPTALRRALVTSHPRQFATKKQGAFCKSLRKSSKSGFNFLGFSRLNHGGAEAEQPQTSHCWWMAMNHYERNDSRDVGITGVCSGRKRGWMNMTKKMQAIREETGWQQFMAQRVWTVTLTRIVMSQLTFIDLNRHIFL